MHEALDWDASPIDAETIKLLLASSDHAIIWGGNYFELPPAQRFLVWDKMQPQNFSLAMCEQAWTNLKGPAKMFRQSVTSYKKSHPTQKSVELMEWCLDFVKDAKTICDPFMGSGTTGVAALRAGRSFIGIEREPQYFEIACSRLRGAEMQASIFGDEPAPPQPIMEQASIFG
jgi:site-specific DNA-methyltransferase (adenine-specific)/modification methylase